MKKMLFISVVAAAMLFSGCGSSGGSDSDPVTGGDQPAAGSGNQPAAGGDQPAAGGDQPAAGQQQKNPSSENDIKDGFSAINGTTNRPIDTSAVVGAYEWLVIQTTEVHDLNGTSYNEAFFPKRTWAEADDFCKNRVALAGTWALPSRLELLSAMTPAITDIARFNDITAPQLIMDNRILTDGNLGAFSSAVFYDQPNMAVYLGRPGVAGSPNLELNTMEADGTPEEYFFTCIKR